MRVAALYLSSSVTAREDAAAALGRGLAVFVSGFELPGATRVPEGWGAAVSAALVGLQAEVLAVQVPDEALEALTDPILRDEAEVVVGHRVPPPVLERAANRVARLALEVEVADPLCAARAFRVETLRSVPLPSRGAGAEAEVMLELASQHVRFTDALVRLGGKRDAATLAELGATFLRAATGASDAEHDGHATLAHLERGATNYNRWLAGQFRKWAGPRVLEIGAGIGTITAHLAPGRELVTALEVDPTYVRRLQNRFRGVPQVEPWLGDVAMADWEALKARGFDSIVLSNVLEHIPDDAGAVRTFAKILPPGGRLILFVPALPALFGSLDEAVGHHRRYTKASLRRVVEENGFALEELKWMNLVGIPGWALNAKLLGRRVLPPLQTRLYDALAPTLASLEAQVEVPVGLSLLAVARRT